MKKTLSFRSILIGSALFIWMIPVSAQQPWTLENCIHYAWDNNIQLKRQELQTELSQNGYTQSKAALLPNLSAGGGQNWNIGHTVNPFTYQFTNSTQTTDNLYIQSTITLFSGFQLINTVSQNRILLDKSLKDFDKAKNDITIQIATAFLQILFTQESLNVNQKQLEVSHQQTEKMAKLVEVGSKSKGDLLVMQAQEASDKYNVVIAKNNLIIANLTLAQLLELKSTDNFSVIAPDSLKIDGGNPLTSVDDIFKLAEVNFPEIKSAELNLQSNQKGLLIAKGLVSPQLTLSGNYGSGYSNEDETEIGMQGTTPIFGTPNYFTQLRENASTTISLNLVIPIFNRLQSKSQISDAKIRITDAQYALEQANKKLYADIQNAFTDAVAALEKFNAASESVVSNSEALKYAQQKYDAGMLSAVDYNTARNNYIKANSDLIGAKYEYVFKLKIIDFYKGVPLVI